MDNAIIGARLVVRLRRDLPGLDFIHILNRLESVPVQIDGMLPGATRALSNPSVES